MSQQLVKKGTNGKHENVMPRSWIEAIKDKNTGQTLVEILQGFNMYFLPYNGNTSATRCLVPTMLRKKGLWITYVKYDGNVYTEWYAADKIDDKSWGDSSNWRIGNNTLVGDITISANGNWVINGVETKFKAVGEKGNTPLLRVANNRLQVSYDLGNTYRNVTNNPVYTKFRWLATSGDTQANNVGRIQASTDEGKTWTNMSNDFINNLHIKKYIGVNESLPTSDIAEGTIYAKGPYYAEDDTLNDNPIYRLWVYAWKGDTLAWQDNGEFTSIAAGVVQEMGDSETEVMSQKAVSTKLSELISETNKIKYREKNIFKRESPNLINLEALIPNTAINSYGELYNVTTNKDYISDYIHVYKDVPYIISGGYTNTDYSLFKNKGDRTNPISYGKITVNTPFIPSEEGYIVLQVRNSSVATETYTTVQFEEGDVSSPYKPYSSVVYRVIDEKYLPFNDVMFESKYIIEKRDSSNLIILDKAQYNTAISGTGSIYSTSSYNVVSDWIPVKGGMTYYLSGGYAENQVVLFANYGEKNNPLAYDKINGWDGATYTPISDGYVVLEIADSSSAVSDRSSTIQFEEGVIASPYNKGGEVKQFFNPVYIEKESINLFDAKAKSGLVEARIDFDTKEIIQEQGNYCTPKLVVPNSDYIYVSGLGNSNSERVCLFYDGDTINYWKFKMYGDSFKIPINGDCSHFVLWFKASDESLDLKNVYIGGLPATYKEGVCTNTFKQVFEHKNEVTIPLDINSNIGEIVVTSESNVSDALIPVHIHYSNRPRYAVDRFDHIYLGSNNSYLKEDVSFSLNGEILRSRRFGGNYTFVPTSNTRFLYFNAQFTHNGVSKIIGSYNGDNGVFVKEDINDSWKEIISNAKFGFIDSNLDIYYKKGRELYCANIDNLAAPTLIYTSPSSSFFVDFDCFTETDDYVFFGTYQNEWDTKVYRISKSDKTANICFDTTQKQHVHKILAINNVIYLCCDGATANNANFDTYPTNLTKGMATFKSSDFGETWETIQFPWSADYGVIGYHNGWYYGSAEASIKYAPSLYRSKDLRTWEIVENMPATAGGTFRVCDKGFIQSSMSSGFLTHNVVKYYDGKKFIPVFDKRLISPAISTGLKPTHNYNNTIVIDGNKCVLLNDQSQTLENAYIFNESGYTVFAYIQADLKAGDNVIKIHKGGCIKDIEATKAIEARYTIKTSVNKITEGSMEGVAINSVGVPSNIDGFTIPYKLEKQDGIMADVKIRDNSNIPVGTLTFSIKEFGYFEGKSYKLLDLGTLQVYRTKSKLQLMEYGKIVAECTLGSMGYYSNISSRIHITFDDNIKVYVNGKLNSTTANTTDFPRGITKVVLTNAKTNDFISNICIYASAMKESQVVRDFEGFNLI